MSGVSRWVVVLALYAGLWGCAVIRPPAVTASVPAAPVAGGLPDGEGWWYARFHIDRPEGGPPRWHIGTLLAGEVIAPVFDRHYADILVWRIHRRAGADEHSHVFSFIFYSTAAGAQRIYSDIAGNPVLARLERDGRVTRVSFDDLARITRPGIGDTSDKNWPPVVRQTWPALIMGASRMWLDTVSTLAAAQPADGSLEQRYRVVNDEIDRLWAEQGQHAVLHHLSAIYAYQPLSIRY